MKKKSILCDLQFPTSMNTT